jgi:hypothetical protein
MLVGLIAQSTYLLMFSLPARNDATQPIASLIALSTPQQNDATWQIAPGLGICPIQSKGMPSS